MSQKSQKSQNEDGVTTRSQRNQANLESFLTRSKDATTQVTHSTGDSEVMKGMDNKLDGLIKTLCSVNNTVTGIEKRIDSFELKLKQHDTDIAELKSGTEFLTKKVENRTAVLQQKLDTAVGNAMRNKIDELENRSRRNNIILYNFQEGSEDIPHACENFVQEFISVTLGLKRKTREPIQVERAHRSPAGRSPNPTAKPRQICARILDWRDRKEILHHAPKILKTVKYKGTSIIVSDDVSDKVRAERKRLLKRMHELRDDNEFLLFRSRYLQCC